MPAETSARDHAQSFRWWLGNPEMTEDEARLHDLLALHQATKELIREQREHMRHYDTDAELFGDDEEPFA